MLEMEYKKMFELMEAYAALGSKERKTLNYLFKLDIFKGGYSQLARQIKMDVGNLRNTLKYLEALGIVYICYDDENLKYNKMDSCFIVYNWMDNLLYQFENDNIFQEEKQKKAFIKKLNN